MATWTAATIPDLSGRGAVVTGANSGLGFQTALELARHGADVTLACRDEERGARAVSGIRALAPKAAVEAAPLDLADLSSIARFADAYRAGRDGLDLLVNNAGVMAIPHRQIADGFEMQLGANHLGHFALTGRLFPLLAARPGARVVTVSTTAHRGGRIDFDDLQHERSYRPWSVYGQSKLANLLFAFELQRRADAAGVDLLSVAAHPGYAATNLQRMTGRRLQGLLLQAANQVVAQSAARGALPSLYAATAPDVTGGAFYGPDGIGEIRGYPKRVKAARPAYDEQTARRLWQVSEDLTGVRYETLDRALESANR